MFLFLFTNIHSSRTAVAIAKPTLTHSWEIDGKELEFVKELGEGTSAKVCVLLSHVCVDVFWSVIMIDTSTGVDNTQIHEHASKSIMILCNSPFSPSLYRLIPLIFLWCCAPYLTFTLCIRYSAGCIEGRRWPSRCLRTKSPIRKFSMTGLRSFLL